MYERCSLSQQPSHGDGRVNPCQMCTCPSAVETVETSPPPLAGLGREVDQGWGRAAVLSLPPTRGTGNSSPPIRYVNLAGSRPGHDGIGSAATDMGLPLDGRLAAIAQRPSVRRHGTHEISAACGAGPL